MGRFYVKDGTLSMKRQKTGVQFDIPLLPELVAELALHPMKPEQPTYLVTGAGKPFTAAGFGGWFRERCDEAGLKHCTAYASHRCRRPSALRCYGSKADGVVRLADDWRGTALHRASGSHTARQERRCAAHIENGKWQTHKHVS